MAASERVVYGRVFQPTPLWMWLTQRASGLLLGPLVLLHMASSTLAANTLLNALLVAVILVHGYSGVRRIAVAHNRLPFAFACAFTWCAVVAVFGALLVVYR